ncbi:transcriptional regulator [Amycolatopsis acidicola]|uniref:Transcriptional regulator n=1 Tax=Amycolatopsis acidicola TaxID=2596893 RepID=A0A5N0VCN2_9PSEU|nr:transcriptional regulator [Amycolatopsis acidicola]
MRRAAREFLAVRRGSIDPVQVGLPVGPRRRVPGLRRDELALLAGIDSEACALVERGDLTAVPASVLHAVASALRLDKDDRRHLFDLARGLGAASARRRTPEAGLRERLRQVLDGITSGPALVRNTRLDILGGNDQGRMLFRHLFEDELPSNYGRYVFLDPRAKIFLPDWAHVADDAIMLLRGEADRYPYEPGLTELVGELCTRSDEFRVRWAARAQPGRGELRRFHHPAAGDLELTRDVFDLAAEPGLSLLVFTAAPGSPSGAALRSLACQSHPGR